MTLLAVTQRQQQLALRAALLRRLIPLWQLFDPNDLNRTLPTWLAAVLPLMQDARKGSGLLAGAYLRQARADVGIEGVAPVVLAGTAPVDQAVTSLTVTSLVAIRTALGAGQTLEQAMRTGFVTSSGAASRIALQGGRDTVIGSVRADRKAAGWSRLASPDACDFCLMLSDRGAVYSAEAVDFAAHDHCACTAVASYGNPSVVNVRTFTPSAKNISDADRANLRAYLKQHYHAA